MDPPKKTTFPPEFLNHFYTICIYTNHNHISGKKYNFYTISKRRPNNRFHFASFRFRRKFEKKKKKTTFPKEYFNEIWLKLGDHEYINIAEIKFG